MGIKRFIYNCLFNKRQRFAIWQAVLFSEYTYRRRGNVDGAAYVRTVINEVAPIAATKQRLYTADEVDAIVKARVSEMIKATAEEAKKLPPLFIKADKPEIRVIKVDSDNHASCEHLDEGDIILAEIKVIPNHQKEEEKEKSDKETTDTNQEEHKEEENKPTDTDKPLADVDEAGDSDENKE